jgi:hypothetical protein
MYWYDIHFQMHVLVLTLFTRMTDSTSIGIEMGIHNSYDSICHNPHNSSN